MERLASTATTSCGYVSWEEVFVSLDKGRREVHYFLKRRDGSSDLAVIGKEKSLRHMTYHYAIRDEALVLLGPSLSLIKLKSRREVIDWLNSIVSEIWILQYRLWGRHPCPKSECMRSRDSSPKNNTGAPDDIMDDRDGCRLDIETLKDRQSRKLGHFTKEFSWLGSSWTCRKRRKHYQSFRRNGFKISVYDFVYVLAEEDKRLVAYLEDMYEDSRGNKMVVVRWFHKIDEVGIVWPHSFSDKEIFFSLCLQDLSIECIDGLATVLSPQHYEKFQNEARHTLLEPYVCEHQFDNDDVKPFDITHIRGYWKQEILRYLFTLSDSKPTGSRLSDDGPKHEENLQYNTGIRPKKRLRWAKVDGKDSVDVASEDLKNVSNCRIDTKIRIKSSSSKQVGSAAYAANKETDENFVQSLVVGSQIEVLSQDSGIRGCWFRASVIKRHKDKVKVQYQDILDAVDEDKKLEEWILASRIAAHDDLGLRMQGRTKIRPALQSDESERSWVVDIGFVVDVWWHDGWWEGIVVQKESEANFRVYFPGEKRVSVFGFSNLRRSQEWIGNGWMQMKERPDLVNSILSSLKTALDPCKSHCTNPAVLSTGDGIQSKQGDMCSGRDISRRPGVVSDLSKDNSLSQLRWKSSRKRTRSSSSGGSSRKLQWSDSYSQKSPDTSDSDASDRFMIPASLKVDRDDCKYPGDPPMFNSSVVPSLTNLVLCR